MLSLQKQKGPCSAAASSRKEPGRRIFIYAGFTTPCPGRTGRKQVSRSGSGFGKVMGLQPTSVLATSSSALATSNVVATSSDALVTNSFLVLVAMHLLLLAMASKRSLHHHWTPGRPTIRHSQHFAFQVLSGHRVLGERFCS